LKRNARRCQQQGDQCAVHGGECEECGEEPNRISAQDRGNQLRK
jgi:hypothetical protein